MENIVNGCAVILPDIHEININTIVYNQKTQSLFSGDSEGLVVQYKKEGKNNEWVVVMDYDDMDIGYIYSSTSIENVVVFGGNDYSVRMINAETMEIMGGKIKTAMECIYSLKICLIENKNAQNEYFLTLTGEDPEFTSGKSNLYHLTDLVQTQIRRLAFNKSKMMKKKLLLQKKHKELLEELKSTKEDNAKLNRRMNELKRENSFRQNIINVLGKEDSDVPENEIKKGNKRKKKKKKK